MKRFSLIWVSLSLISSLGFASPVCYENGWDTFKTFRFSQDLNTGYGISNFVGNVLGLDLVNASAPAWINTQVSPYRISANEELSMSPDGKYLVIMTDLDVIVWDTISKKRVSFVSYPSSTSHNGARPHINSIRFNQASNVIAVEFLQYSPSSVETTIFEFPSLKKIYSRVGMTKVVPANDPGVLFHSAPQEIVKYDYLNDKVIGKFSHTQGYGFFHFAAAEKSLFVISGQQLMVVSTDNMELKTSIDFDFDSREHLTKSIFGGITFRENHKLLYTNAGAVYNLETGRFIFRKTSNYQNALGAELSPDGTKFAQLFNNGLVQVYNVSNWSLEKEFCHVSVDPQ